MLKTPPLQTASATIDTLCGRLQSATLLEDRRAAILGLRSFAKQYPASVASGSLRELIATLRRDGLGEAGSSQDGASPGRRQSVAEGGDVDTIRLVLETLLMLFNPDASSPEASDEIAYFMADGFSMRQDNITLLLSLLDPASPFADYYSRLYSLQLLQAICAARPERLQECILSAPLGVSRLVSVLDDQRDAVRNAGLLLLVDLTSGANEELRKIVAFEDVFGKVFSLIRAEGGLAEAGITAQDCLSLLANLIKNSPSNQTMFRESGCVSQLTALLAQSFPSGTDEAPFIAQAREKGAWGLLQLLGLFLEAGDKMSTPQNQAAFFRAGAAQVLIDLAFAGDLPPPIRTLALRCAAALIASNTGLQETFAGLTISAPPSQASDSADPRSQLKLNGSRSASGSKRPSVERPRLYIIEALLDLSLNQPPEDSQLRTAGSELIQAYLRGHERIKQHFLQRAIVGHANHESAANALNALSNVDGGDVASVVYAGWIISDLVAESPEAKTAVAGVTEGDEESGEDVLTFIQALGSQLQAALQQPVVDERLVAAYAGLLTIILWDFADGVDNLLAEGSGLLQALVSAASSSTADVVAKGMAAVLLGAIYEFSTKDSPIPRRTLAPLLTQKLGRAKYLDALSALRRHSAIRDFDLEPEDDAQQLLSSAPFVELFTTEFSRLRRAIDKDPGVEVLPRGDAEAGVDRDILDELRGQIQAAQVALAEAREGAVAKEQQLEQVTMGVQKELQAAKAEVERMRRINAAVQQGHEAELEELARKTEEAQRGVVAEHVRVLEGARREAEQRLQELRTGALRQAQGYENKLAELGTVQREEQRKHADTARSLEELSARHEALNVQHTQVQTQHNDLRIRHEGLSRQLADLQAHAYQVEVELQTVRAESEGCRMSVERLEAEVLELNADVRAREEELKAEREGFGELETEVESTKAALVTAQIKLAAVRAELQTAKSIPTPTPAAADNGGTEKLTALSKQLEEAKAAEKEAREELESMLLLMGDLEAKRDGYRDKVKDLGGEVTDVEESDEEEEEDGDEAEE